MLSVFIMWNALLFSGNFISNLVCDSSASTVSQQHITTHLMFPVLPRTPTQIDFSMSLRNDVLVHAAQSMLA